MNRSTEAALILSASLLAAFGVTLVNLAQAGTVDAQVGLTFLTFAIAFGAVHVATRRLAAGATPTPYPPSGCSPRSGSSRSTGSMRIGLDCSAGGC